MADKESKKTAAASAASDRDKTRNGTLAQIEKEFGKGSIMRLGDNHPVDVPVISTGASADDSKSAETAASAAQNEYKTVNSMEQLFEAIKLQGREGLALQRYKGLGEMNAEQLWETTMDPARRKMVRVTMEDAVEAERIFTLLMGDAVEPRREYIERHAAGVKDLDI